MTIAAGLARKSDFAAGNNAGGGGGLVPRPALLARLGGPARVTMVSAPAGSGKTVLLRSWIRHAGRAACVAAMPHENDPRRFWLSVAGALRQAGPARSVTGAPEPDGRTLAERLLADLAALAAPLWLVIDDVHELGPEALRQLELLIMRAPPQLRFVLAARHDVRLGLHRLRLEDELAEIRAADLAFTLDEARELFAAAGTELDEPTLTVLHERTEGWAAGLRMAALSLAGHPDPARFAAGFSGSDRTVTEYLMAEVLDRQSGPVRRLLLRTSILGRVNGELADLLTGASGGERLLQDLEAAGAFVVSLEAGRTWFRYHQMFADFLHLELRRSAPGEIAGLHWVAAEWFAGNGYPVEAVRHAQATRDWDLTARLLAGHWPGLYPDGQPGPVHGLLAGFPPGLAAADPRLAAMTAADELAERHGWTDEQLPPPHRTIILTWALLVHTLTRLGETERAAQFLAALSEQDRDHGEIRIATAELRLAQGDARAATTLLAPVLDGPVPPYWRTWSWEAQACMLEAIARDALGEEAAAESALERTLDLVEPNGDLTPFLLYPAPELLQRHTRHRTAHAALITEIRDQLAAGKPALPAPGPPPPEPLSGSETRVLRYLPTNLTAPEIARELSVSRNTVKTHMRNLYAKLGTHRRGEAVARARDLGLLAPSGLTRTKLHERFAPG